MEKKYNKTYEIIATSKFRNLTQADKEFFPDATEDALIAPVEMGRNNYWPMLVDKGQVTLLSPGEDGGMAFVYPTPSSVDISIKTPIIYSDEIELSEEEDIVKVDVWVDFQSGKYTLYVANEFVADFDLKDDAVAVADDCCQFYSEKRVAEHREQNEDPDPNFRVGWALHLEGDFFSACRQFLKAARRGHLEAQYMVGWIQTQPEWNEFDKEKCYEEDDEYPGNFDAGIKWYKIAANNGHSNARYELGNTLAERYIYLRKNPMTRNDEEWGSAPDPVEAYMWLRIAVNDGDRSVGREGEQKVFDQLKNYMTDDEINLGERLTRVWYDKGASHHHFK
jgi:hypothetical protein